MKNANLSIFVKPSVPFGVAQAAMQCVNQAAEKHRITVEVYNVSPDGIFMFVSFDTTNTRYEFEQELGELFALKHVRSAATITRPS